MVERIVTCWFGAEGMTEDYREIYEKDKSLLAGEGIEYLLVRKNPYQCRKTSDYRFETDEFRVRWIADHPQDCYKDLDLEIIEWIGKICLPQGIHCLGLFGLVAEPCLIIGNGDEHLMKDILGDYEKDKPERCGWLQIALQNKVGLISEKYFIHHRFHVEHLASIDR